MQINKAKQAFNQAKVEKYLAQIDRIFGIKSLLNKSIDTNLTKSYYEANGKYYRKLHSKNGAMHFPIFFKDGRGNRKHSEGLLQQAIFVQEYIKKSKHLNNLQIIELGSGQGFNSVFLAQKNPKNTFLGIDLTPSNIKFSQQQVQQNELSNLAFEIGNFEELKHLKSDYFNIGFAIECLSHSIHIEKALAEAYRILATGGQLIVFDGFQKKQAASNNPALQLAAQLFSIGFAMQPFRLIDSWLDIAKKIGFEVELIEDLSQEVLPNLIKFEEGSAKLFRYPLLTKFIMQLRILPLPLFKHAISGLLGPLIMESETVGYYKIVLKKV